MLFCSSARQILLVVNIQVYAALQVIYDVSPDIVPTRACRIDRLILIITSTNQ